LRKHFSILSAFSKEKSAWSILIESIQINCRGHGKTERRAIEENWCKRLNVSLKILQTFKHGNMVAFEKQEEKKYYPAESLQMN
jgi:hypothetical protein